MVLRRGHEIEVRLGSAARSDDYSRDRILNDILSLNASLPLCEIQNDGESQVGVAQMMRRHTVQVFDAKALLRHTRGRKA